MIGDSIFESQFPIGGLLNFPPRYPSYANYRSEVVGMDTHGAVVGRLEVREIGSPQVAYRPINQHRSDEAIYHKADLGSAPGYYAQVGDLKPRVTDIGVRPQIETEEKRRQTIGGSPLEGLIAEFRSNSLGDDLRKLKEAHQEIIEELKSAMFKKSKKKAGRSPQRKPAGPHNQRNPLGSPTNKIRHVQNIPAMDTVKEDNTQHRRIEARQERPADRVHKPQPTKEKMFTQPAKREHVTEEQQPQRIKTATVLEVRDKRQQDHNGKQSYPSPLPNRREIGPRIEVSPKGQQLRQQYEQDGFGTLHPKVIEEILGLREIKISLMKQLNQETSNYNRVIMENRQILNENHQLRQQMGAKANSENIPLVHKITKENQKLKEKIAKLEQELQKATTKSFLEKNSKEGIRSALDPQHEDHMNQLTNNERLQEELKQYRQLYGQLPRATNPSSPKQQHRRIGNW